MATQGPVMRAEPRTVDEARRAVAETRGRMSNTLDEIESRLLSKKQEWTDRMDVMRPVKQRVRARPWLALAAAFGLGVVAWKLRHRDPKIGVEAPPPGWRHRLLQRI